MMTTEDLINFKTEIALIKQAAANSNIETKKILCKIDSIDIEIENLKHKDNDQQITNLKILNILENTNKFSFKEFFKTISPFLLVLLTWALTAYGIKP